MNPFVVALLVYASLLVFYVLYIAAINIYRDWDSLAGWVQIVSFAPLVVMIIVDMLMNFTLFSILFFDPPDEATVTQRLARYRAGPDSWRKKVAETICEQALNPFDPTRRHC
jgi:glucan phosphoethanolaminetransferase (alkaline phosphatase superfamily)